MFTSLVSYFIVNRQSFYAIVGTFAFEFLCEVCAVFLGVGDIDNQQVSFGVVA